MTKSKKSKNNNAVQSQEEEREAGQRGYLGRFEEAPDYVKDNQHIHKGYRIGFQCPKRTVKSLFMIHNETVNIWTHLIGFIVVFFLIFEVIAYEMETTHVMGKSIIQGVIQPYKASSEAISQMDSKVLCEMMNEGLQEGESQYECSGLESIATRKMKPFSDQIPTWPVMIMLVGSAICLACSATFHLIYQMNQKVFKISTGLDFAGIGINMSFSPIPCFYYSLYCHQSTATIYISVILVAGCATFATQMIDWFTRKENFIYRAGVFVFSSVVCVVGLIHLLINQFVYHNYGDQYSILPSLYFFIPALLSYACGFYTYATQCPERYKPGQFDICGHSHQIWHVFVFIAIIMTYFGALVCYQIRSKWDICPAIDLLS